MAVRSSYRRAQRIEAMAEDQRQRDRQAREARERESRERATREAQEVQKRMQQQRKKDIERRKVIIPPTRPVTRLTPTTKTYLPPLTKGFVKPGPVGMVVTKTPTRYPTIMGGTPAGTGIPTPTEAMTERGEIATGILPNVGWVAVKDEYGKQKSVYDPQAYATLTGHSPGYYGTEGYGGEAGKEPTIPPDFDKWGIRKQTPWMKEHGLIHPDDVLLPDGSFLSAKIAAELKKEDPVLYRVLITKGWDAYAARYAKQQEQITVGETRQAKALLSELREKGFEEPPTMRHLYPRGGAPFASYEKAPYVYNIAGALEAGFERARLVQVFGKAIVLKAEEFISDVKLLNQYKTVEAMIASGVSKVVAAAKRLSTPTGVLPRDLSLPVARKYSAEIPDGFPSDAEYKGLSVRQKLDLGKLGDVRALFGVTTWAAGVKRSQTKAGMEQPIPSLEAKAIYGLDPVYQDIKERLEASPKNPQIQAEMDVYMEQWRRGGITTAAIAGAILAPYTFGAVGAVGTQLITKIPAVIRAIPIIGGIPRVAVGLAQYLTAASPIVYTGATISEAIQSTDIERKWQDFGALSAPKQDAWAKRSGYDNFQTLTDSQKANVLLHYAVPPGYSLSQWSRTLGEHTERLIELSQKGSTWLGENAPVPFQPIVVPLRIAGGLVVGAVVESASYMAQLPLIAATLVDKVPSGTHKEFAKEVATGMAAFFTTALPAAFRADPYFTSGRIVGLFVLTPATMVKLAKSGFAGLKPRYIPERAMAMEFLTLRVEFSPKQWAMTGKMSSAELKALGTRIEATLLAGKDYVKDFGVLKLKVENVPYQKVVGNALFHFTPDITVFKGQVPIKGKLYFSPQAAVQAGLAALVKGQKATHPGVVEVRVPEGFLVKGVAIEKLIGRGKTIEIEAPLKGVLDPIPGWQGKGVSSNAYFGSYPIRRFTLQGIDYPGAKINWKGIAERIKGKKDIVIDLDLTLIDKKGKLLPGAKDFLLGLKEQGKTVTLWTHSTLTRTNTILSKNGIKQIFDRVITREKYEPTGKSPDAFKDIRKVRGDVLIDNSLAQAKQYAELGLKNKIITPKVDTPIIKLTPKKLAALRLMAMKESVVDAFIGWHGRMQAHRRAVAANKRLTQTLNKVNEGISKLKEGEVELIGRSGEIVKQRDPIPHPTKVGTIKPRVTAIVRNSKGEIMLVMDRAETSYGLPGGQIDIKWSKGKLGFTRLPSGKRVLKPDGAAHGQIKSETGVGLTKTKLLDTYTGKVNEHALSGSRVYEALAKTDRIDISVSKGELIKAKWWDGKSEITVYPATYDILAAVARKYRLDMSKVRIDASRPILNRTRDTGFASRVARGEKLTPAQIKDINNIEIASLRRLRNEMANPNLWDYIRGETDFALLAELIKGRQRAVKWSQAKPSEIAKFTKEMVSSLKETIKQIKSMTEAEIKRLYGMSKAELLKRLDTKKLEEARTPEALRKEVEGLAKEQAKLANKRLARDDIRAYVERGSYLNRRYVSYLDRAMRLLGAGVRYERIPEELEQYRPALAEIYREYRVIEPPRRQLPYKPPTYIPAPYMTTLYGEIYKTPPYTTLPYTTPPYVPPPTVPPPTVPPPTVPPPTVPPPTVPPPPPLPKVRGPVIEKGRVRDYEHAVAWRQGMLKRKGKLEAIYKVWSPPYEQSDLETFFKSELPMEVKITPGGIKSAYKSIHLFKGKELPGEEQTADIGAFLATIEKPTASPGKKGAIKFKRDPKDMPKSKQKKTVKRKKTTRSDISLTSGRL